MRLLVDTNVFLDVIYQIALLGPISKEFFIQTRQNFDEIYVCASTLKDIAYFAHKQFHDNKKTNGIQHESIPFFPYFVISEAFLNPFTNNNIP